MIFYLLGGVVTLLVVQYLLQTFKFRRYGVKYFAPVPLLGNMAKTLFRIKSSAEIVTDMYHEFSNERFYGKFELTTTMVEVRDLELVKKVAVKDFEHFVDRRQIFGQVDTTLVRSIAALTGQDWKDMRSTLSPAFTSSKIRLMVPFITEVGDHMILALNKLIKESKTGKVDINCKDLTARYANDVIASCAFGLKVDSHNDTNNEFYSKGKVVASFSFRDTMILLLSYSFPIIGKIFSLDFEKPVGFFLDLFTHTMREREAQSVIRPDLIHLLVEANKGKLTHEDIKSDEKVGFATVEESSVGQKQINKVWPERDLVAQALVFFIAGFETISTGMTYMMYEMARNPEVQERLVQEIKEIDVKHGGKLDFNSIQNMQYLDMVISEVLRLWPPAVSLDRICTKEYNMGKPNATAKNDYIVQQGNAVSIPVFALQRDPAYYPNPDKFDPERFSDENKHKIPTFAYMPFGAGPRNCIGSRFALCEMKIMAYQILKHFQVSPSAETVIPPVLIPASFNVKIKGGECMTFECRQ